MPDEENICDPEPWEEDRRELEENSEDYVVFEPMSSNESFGIMSDFAHSVTDSNLQERLFDALNRKKPFRNFKEIVDLSGEYRRKWFDYKNKRFVEYVKEQLEFYNQNEEE